MKRSPLLLLVMLAALASLRPGAFAQDQQASPPRKVISRTAPEYPQVARSMKLRGAVKLEVLVQASGSVKTIFVKGGNPVLVQSAQSAVHAWKWERTDHDSTEQVEFQFQP
jgi:TonB family protein